jgi:hypothetical protein
MTERVDVQSSGGHVGFGWDECAVYGGGQDDTHVREDGGVALGGGCAGYSDIAWQAWIGHHYFWRVHWDGVAFGEGSGQALRDAA